MAKAKTKFPKLTYLTPEKDGSGTFLSSRDTLQDCAVVDKIVEVGEYKLVRVLKVTKTASIQTAVVEQSA